jgi:hypothetical protein
MNIPDPQHFFFFKYFEKCQLSTHTNFINFYLSKDIPCKQGCESRRQKSSTCSRPSFREIWKVSSLSRSLSLSGKKVSPRPSPRSSFPRPPHAENEPSIAVRGSRLPPPIVWINGWHFHPGAPCND